MLIGGPSGNFVKSHLLHELHLGIKSQNEKKWGRTQNLFPEI